MKSPPRDGQGLTLPPELPVLPLQQQVLLPASTQRVTVPSGSDSAGLLLHLIRQDGARIFVAALPVLEDGQKRAGKLGTAAQLLQISRQAQSGDWQLTLEGCCRIEVEPDLDSEWTTVKQLEPMKNADGTWPPADLDREGQHLASQLMATAASLLTLLQQVLGLAAATRMLPLLHQMPPGTAADLLTATFTRSVALRSAVLQCTEVNKRLKVVLQICQEAHKSVERVAGAVSDTGALSQPARQSLQARRRALQQLQAGSQLPGLPAARPAQEATSPPAEGDDEAEAEEELPALMSRIKAAQPPPEVFKVARREFQRLQRSNEMHPGHAMARAYLETLADLPWNKFAAPGSQGHGPSSPSVKGPDIGTARDLSLAEARSLLDQEHFGLDRSKSTPQFLAARHVMSRYPQKLGLQVKERIVQYLAVRRLRGWDASAPILCFIGPPGVGKTTLARSIAKVLQRPFHRISVGGIHDEAEIRGHRRTYIGAMPGRVIQGLNVTGITLHTTLNNQIMALHPEGLRRTGVRDPLLLMDEIDKMGSASHRGDPSAALLEVFDPEQNHAFVDNYLAVPFDLSKVAFVATGNTLSEVPPPLLDRLEVITLPGYTLDEKVAIAERHLVPLLLKEHGLTAKQLVFARDNLQVVAQQYTREAGVRALSRSLAAICRHVAADLVAEADVQLHKHAAEAGSGLSEPQHDTSDLPHDVPGLQSDEHDSDLTSSAALPDMAAAGRSAGAGRGMASHRQAAGPTCGQPASSSRGLDMQTARSGPPAASGHHAGTSSRGLERQVGRLASAAAAAEQPPPGGPAEQADHHHLAEHAQDAIQQHQEALQASHHHSLDQGRQSWFSFGGLFSGWPSRQAPSQRLAAPVAPARQAGADSRHAASPGSAAGMAAQAGAGPHLDSRQAATERPAGEEAGSTQAEQDDAHSEHGSTAAAPAEEARQQLQQPQLPSIAELAAALPQRMVDLDLIEAVLGPPKFDASDAAERVVTPGSAAGLVWTAAGGAVMYVEACCTSVGEPGRQGRLTLTGQAGAVLQESAQLALAWVRAHSWQLDLDGAPAGTQLQHPEQQPASHQAEGASCSPAASSSQWASCASRLGSAGTWTPAAGTAPATALRHVSAQEKWAAQGAGQDSVTEGRQSCPSRGISPAANWDVHVHLPAGAVQKDGPSAGITLAVALVSLFTGRHVRADTAMTGELTLRGLVLPIGGVKDKLLAAHHAGMKRILIPSKNMRDVKADIPRAVSEQLDIVSVQRLEDVLAAAFTPPITLLAESKM